jgi:hypothetical protein
MKAFVIMKKPVYELPATASPSGASVYLPKFFLQKIHSFRTTSATSGNMRRIQTEYHQE